MNYQVQRGMSEIVTTHDLGDEQWRIVLTFFKNVCAFCGCEDTGNSRTGLIPDHLVPASQFGDMVLGNAVPACQDCNDARGNKDWRVWLQQSFPEQAEARARAIEKYLQKFPYTPASPETRLNEAELSEYKSILGEWKSLWERARALRDRVDKRRNAT